MAQGLLLPWPQPSRLLVAQEVPIMLSVFAITLKRSTLPILLSAVWLVERAPEHDNERLLLPLPCASTASGN